MLLLLPNEWRRQKMKKERNPYDVDAGERKYYFFEEDYEAME